MLNIAKQKEMAYLLNQWGTMATEEKKTETEEKQETPPEEKKKSLSINPKIFIIGLPLFIVQLIAVYFITANILLSKVQEHTEGQTEEPKTEESEKKKENKTELGKFIYSIEDIIVNPASTEGKRLLLTSVGLDLKSEEELQSIKSKEILVKDIIVSTLSSKSLNQLSNSAYKDSLKTEIADRLKQSLPSLELNTVYLSKYIIQ